jgi:sugar phosphate isomerase/epimerase
VNFHTPFADLRPGALDDKIRQVRLERIKQVLELAHYFHHLKVVCHPCFNDLYFVSVDDSWLENSCQTWIQIIQAARDSQTVIALANVYEKELRILCRLFEILSSYSLCFCFDTGHFNVFSCVPLNVSLTEMGKYLGHLHIHNNFGGIDQHLPVGSGTFPFIELFQSLRAMKAHPSIALEAHSQDDLWQSLVNIKKMSLLDDMK